MRGKEEALTKGRGAEINTPDYDPKNVARYGRATIILGALAAALFTYGLWSVLPWVYFTYGRRWLGLVVVIIVAAPAVVRYVVRYVLR